MIKFVIVPKLTPSPKMQRKSTPLMIQSGSGKERLRISTGINIPIGAFKDDEIDGTVGGYMPAKYQEDDTRLRKLRSLIAQRNLQAQADAQRDMNVNELRELVEAFKQGSTDLNRSKDKQTKPKKKRQPNIIDYCEAFIPTAMDRRNKHARGDTEKIDEKTVQQYTQLLPLLRNFKHYTRCSMDFRDIDIKWHDKFLDWADRVELYKASTIGKHIKSIKQLAYYAKKDGLVISPDIHNDRDFDKPKPRVVDVQYFTLENLEAIKALDLSGNNRLADERDRLIIGCWTGLRISDLKRLSMDMVTLNERRVGRIRLKTTKKPSKDISIPVTKEIQAILDRRGDFPPFRDENEFNDGIKELAKMIGMTDMKFGGLMQMQAIERKRSNGEVYIVEANRKKWGNFEQWQLMASHSCRRSFASNLYGFMQNQVIMAITGHSKESTFLRYIGVTPEENADRFEEMFDKMMLERGLV